MPCLRRAKKVELALVPCSHTLCQACLVKLVARRPAGSGSEAKYDPLDELFGSCPTSQGECHMCRRPFLQAMRIFLGSGI